MEGDRELSEAEDLGLETNKAVAELYISIAPNWLPQLGRPEHQEFVKAIVAVNHNWVRTESRERVIES